MPTCSDDVSQKCNVLDAKTFGVSRTHAPHATLYALLSMSRTP